MLYDHIKIHPLFISIKRLFEFFILSSACIANPKSRFRLVKEHPELTKMLKDYIAQTDLRTIVDNDGKYETSMNEAIYMNYFASAIIIFMFYLLTTSRYRNDFKQSDLFHFLRHIRDGAAHNNKICFNKNEKHIEAQWRDKSIKKELAGRTVIPDFITLADVYLLMGDISQLLFKYDTQLDSDK